MRCAHCHKFAHPTIHGRCPHCGMMWKDEEVAAGRTMASHYKKTLWKGTGVGSVKKIIKKADGR